MFLNVESLRLKWQSSAPKSNNKMLKGIRKIGQRGTIFVRMLNKDIYGNT